MPYAVELALDDGSASVVRALWRRAADAGFPFMAESGAHPHVSLAIWDDIDRPAMEHGIARLAAETAPIDVLFPTIDSFALTGVLFLALANNRQLLEIQDRCHRALASLGRAAWPHYGPGVWVPHCTLAMDLDDALVRVRAVLEPAPLPLRGRLERAELVQFRPVRHLMAAPLAGR
jgi:2'-5' RNA ligase